MPITVQTIIAVALAGAFGTLLRFGIGSWVQRLSSPGFPWGTLTVNVAGCFLAGLIVTWIGTRSNIDPTLRIAVLIGFLGAFTTFSTFIMEASELVRTTSLIYAGVYVILQNGVGLLALGGGVWIARTIS
ncbi:putative fluoride ion transporter CrcB [bacterium BMS3Bbin04]|nr:putative fluoride ion transporter CrcB [bacterium BMS3Bbin04]